MVAQPEANLRPQRHHRGYYCACRVTIAGTPAGLAMVRAIRWATTAPAR
jgi:hypothetical protein